MNLMEKCTCMVVFSRIIRDHFNLCFAATGPRTNRQLLFVMDNGPSQNSGPAYQAMEGVEAKLHKIPPRSPGLNPMENMFHVLRYLLDDEAKSCNIVLPKLSISSKEDSEFIEHLKALTLKL